MEKKVAKKPAKTTKVEKEVKPVKTASAKKAVAKPAVKPVEKVEKVEAVQPIKAEAKVKKPVMLNQELNLLIGLFAVLAIISLCFAFQGGESEILGWELFLKGGEYSGVFKGLMILYVASIFIDCVLAVRIETESEVLNIVEKALYMFTLVINIVVLAVLYSLISSIGIGLIIFLIVSIISAIVKLARIYAQNK